MRKVPLILVADDERVVAESLVQILQQEGFETAYALNGEAAVQSAREKRPDVVICDILMPVMNGLAAAKQIRTILPQTNIILFSGQAAAAKLLEQAEADGYRFELLAKPVDPEVLLAIIARKLDITLPIQGSVERHTQADGD